MRHRPRITSFRKPGLRDQGGVESTIEMFNTKPREPLGDAELHCPHDVPGNKLGSDKPRGLLRPCPHCPTASPLLRAERRWRVPPPVKEVVLPVVSDVDVVPCPKEFESPVSPVGSIKPLARAAVALWPARRAADLALRERPVCDELPSMNVEGDIVEFASADVPERRPGLLPLTAVVVRADVAFRDSAAVGAIEAPRWIADRLDRDGDVVCRVALPLAKVEFKPSPCIADMRPALRDS